MPTATVTAAAAGISDVSAAAPAAVTAGKTGVTAAATAARRRLCRPREQPRGEHGTGQP
jgi:hypothetical protein